ncbi:MAG: Penicillin-binding protein 2 [Berkelbacteria bacterium GW2011_GWA1_36_9]|uniref:Penicillin-binding protein 2 n=1 Tax=Berkelbacteria bacterium GW2011_GWA1_36_9 TaxID=1618331 RepID=A0A0G0I192_9BACT|nr:MAG: Penicillin-binding protein 2 [Berkelbacteria bacterium GW2011_GWA1_36_9]
MSIFDLYDDRYLPGDKSGRSLRQDVLEYDHFNKDATGGEIFQEKKKSFWLPYLISFLAFGVLMTQLLRLQITQGSFNRNLAEGNRIRAREIAAPRGLIYDSSGKILAQNKASFNLEIYPLDFPRDATGKEEIFQKLSEITQIPKTEIEDKVAKKGFLTYDPIVLKENLDRDTAMILEYKTVNLPGVVIAKDPVREYQPISGLGPVLGYVGKVNDKDLKNHPDYGLSDEIGQEGLELFYEKYLRGKPGILEVEVDSRGRQQRQLSATAPMPGNNLTLSIDGALEAKMAESLGAQVSAVSSPGGAIVAVNPQTGQILGMASFPTFDNNIFTSINMNEEYNKLINDPAKPMFNRVISGTYPSGSIIKPVVAAAGLQEGIITANTTINAPGEIKVGNWSYPDWKIHGLTDVRKAIAESVNIFFYALAGGWDKIKGLGIAKLDDYLIKFGFQEKTGIDLLGEASGLVPTPEWKEKNKKEIWYLGDTYHLGIGQGDFLITPLQMAMATSVIVNGGELLRPQIVSKITDKDGNVIQDFKKDVKSKNLIDDQNLQVVREGMRQAVTSGSAKLLGSLPVPVAAKTGTAQFGAEGKTHAWMTAFAPYNNPQIMIVALVEEGGEGYATAGPVVYDVLNWYFNH